MKFSLTFLLFLPGALFSQDKTVLPSFKAGIFLSVSPAVQIFDLWSSEEDSEIHGYDFFSIGLTTLLSINNHVAIETGLIYSKGRFEIKPWGSHSLKSEEYFTLGSIPLAFRASFFKYFFASGGILLDFDFSKPGEVHNQSGIGILMGTGFNYDFKNGLSILLSPEIKFHSMLSYKNVFANHRILETAVKLGVLYQL